MSDIEQKCFDMLKKRGIDIHSSIDYDVNGDIHSLTFEYILNSFMQASDDSKEMFYEALTLALSSDNKSVENFFESMGQLLLMTHLSQKFKV